MVLEIRSSADPGVMARAPAILRVSVTIASAWRVPKYLATAVLYRIWSTEICPPLA